MAAQCYCAHTKLHHIRDCKSAFSQTCTQGFVQDALLDAQVLRRSGTEQEQKYAKTIEPVSTSFITFDIPSIASNAAFG